MNKPTDISSPCEQLFAPNEVVKKMVMHDASPARAWREYLGISTAAVAARLGMLEADYVDQEANEELPDTVLEQIADALGIDARLLKV